MKKKMIAAGAASLALAAMPVVGVFATNESYTDTLILTLTESCSFTRDASTAHGLGDNNPTGGAWGNNSGANPGTQGHTDTYSAPVAINHPYAALATSSFDVTCNDPDGYQVTVSTSGFTASGVTGADYAWDYVYGGTLQTGGQSMWTIASDHSGKDLEHDIVMKSTSMPSGGTDSLTVTYGAFVDDNQPAGSYTASAQYTFAQLPVQANSGN